VINWWFPMARAAHLTLGRPDEDAWERLHEAVLGMRGYVVPVAVHILLVAVSTYGAFWLRFDGDLSGATLASYLTIAPWVIVGRSVLFAPLRLYRGLWKYTGIWDLSRIVLAVTVSTVLLYGPAALVMRPGTLPRSIPIIDSLLLISLLGGVRLARRLLDTESWSGDGRPVLIIGAGHAGEMIVREMRRGGLYRPVGLVDDNPLKQGKTIHGVTVLGACIDLPRIVDATSPAEVLLAIPSATSGQRRRILQRLQPYKLSLTTLPGLKDLVNGQVGIKQIRPLAIEDLLPRSPVTLDEEAVRQMVRGRCVLVTGAGGSIGSELSRHLARLSPERLVLYERYENGLHAVVTDLRDQLPALPIHPVIGDITDRARVEQVMAEHRPDLVFHAAAHKHVPLMEGNPCEAVKNNIAGTMIVSDVARASGVGRFVFISTDKAVNPSSVMGATKRVAELIVQGMGQSSRTHFVTVRFGNVLGSNGSVIPRMVEQIRAGGPVTVTHPDIQRYFMLIPEAVELVLQAAVLAERAETFVLDMGEQLKVLDVARHLIRLSGLVPDRDIAIKFIGLRPGEKLMEELVGSAEALEPSGVPKIFRVRKPQAAGGDTIAQAATALIEAARRGDEVDVLAHLYRIVPEFSRPAAIGGSGRDADSVSSAARSRTYVYGKSMKKPSGPSLPTRLPSA
jgi:FlaA1/EpsC-like NDP-sugar epimerase